MHEEKPHYMNFKSEENFFDQYVLGPEDSQPEYLLFMSPTTRFT